MSFKVSKCEDWARSVLGAGVSGFPDSWSENDPVCLTQESSLLSEIHIPSQVRNPDTTLIIGKPCKGCRIRTYTLDRRGSFFRSSPAREKKAERADLSDWNEVRGLRLVFLLLGSMCCCDHVLLRHACLRDQIAGQKGMEKKDFSTDL